MQTIEECIYYGKPILVYPLSIGTDQFGNSCRVVYHNVGLRGNVNRDSASAIETKLHQLLSGPYRKNIQKMRQEYLESRSFDEGVAKINELIGSTIVREVV
jgi:UDP:flavonoid glycosyltransferase YjiC (YdhE family)